MMDGLLFCIPQSNERYQFTPKGIGPMYWLADDPIEPPANSQSLHDLDVTIIRVWADQSLVGMSDQLSGKKGFDRFLEVIATSVLKAANQDGGNEDFMADVPIDQSGRLERFRFERLESGILKGVRQDPDGSESYIIVLRPPVGEEQPHLMLCAIVSAVRTHLCMNFVELLDQRMAITIAGKQLERSFRLSEEVKSDLSRFVMRPVSAP